MNKYINDYVLEAYGINAEKASVEELSKVTEIIASDVSFQDNANSTWDFSAFPNLKKIVCSYNHVEVLNISSNAALEYIDFQGARGWLLHKVDFSGNPHLKEVHSGQDGAIELDFSNNPELEFLKVCLNPCLRWVDVSNCSNLKKIHFHAGNLPFVDLTHCPNLEYVNISYWNLYRDHRDDFGEGYPRPFVFVREDFSESIIDKEVRELEDYTYYLVKVAPNSVEERFLDKVISMKDKILAIPEDRYGRGVAIMHYKLLEMYKSMQ